MTQELMISNPSRLSVALRLVLFAMCIVSLGGFRFQLAGIDPTQSFQGFTASYAVYIADVASIFLALVISILYSKEFFTSLNNAFPIFLLPILAFSSSIISASPWVTMFESTKYLFAFIIPISASILWYRKSKLQFSYELLKATLILSIIIVIIYPKYGLHGSSDVFQSTHAGAWRGIFGHRTDFGYCCAALSGLAFANVVYRKKISDVIVLIVSIFSLYKAGSGGASIVSALSIIAIYFHYALKNSSVKIKMSLSMILFSIMIIFFASMFSADGFLYSIGEDSSFTGRVPLWSYIIDSSPLNYLYGLGYISGFNSFVLPSLQMGNFNAPNAQGAYMEALIAFGIIGPLVIILINAIYTIRFFKSFFKKENIVKFYIYSLPTSSILIFMVFTSTIVESYILQSNKVLICIAVILNFEYKNREKIIDNDK